MLTEILADHAVELSIGGMTCSGCVTAVTKALSRVPGVTGVAIDLAKGRARVEGDAQMQSLVSAVRQAGFEADGAGRTESKPARAGGGCGCGC